MVTMGELDREAAVPDMAAWLRILLVLAGFLFLAGAAWYVDGAQSFTVFSTSILVIVALAAADLIIAGLKRRKPWFVALVVQSLP